MSRLFSLLAVAALLCGYGSLYAAAPHSSPVGLGYSSTSVNAAVFRACSLASLDDTQYIAYYDSVGNVVLGKRTIGSDDWTLHTTQYKGNVLDGHNVISIGVDGDGLLHVAFDHHGNPLRYATAVAPGSLELTPLRSMTGIDEDNVTYPEFYRLADGDLLFVYRSGASGRGNMAINRYDTAAHAWHRVSDSLLDGQERRSPYWQLCVDANDVIHLSWVWRETWLVETNHDLCYAKSTDGGETWQRSDGSYYTLPITADNAEYARRIPQGSDLINQTSMTADADSHPYIATYWRDAGCDVPEYRVVWHDGQAWHDAVVGVRTKPFSLSGGGTKSIPISRPRILALSRPRSVEVDSETLSDSNDDTTYGFPILYMLLRDRERFSRVTLGVSSPLGPDRPWTFTDLTDYSVGDWEPTVDNDLWRSAGCLNIFVQQVNQGDGERPVPTPPTPVIVLQP